MWHCLNLLGPLDPDDENIISFRNVWSYSPSDSVTSQKNGSEGNYVNVQKKRVFFVYPNSKVSTETAWGIFRLSLAEAELVLGTPDQPVLRYCLEGDGWKAAYILM